MEQSRRFEEIRLRGDDILRKARRVLSGACAVYIVDCDGEPGVGLLVPGGVAEGDYWAQGAVAQLDYHFGIPPARMILEPEGELAAGAPRPELLDFDDFADYRRLDSSKPLLLFHGCEEAAARAASGLDPRMDYQDPFHRQEAVYLSTRPEIASQYGEEVLVVDATGLALYEDPLEDAAWFCPAAIGPERLCLWQGQAREELLQSFGRLSSPTLSD